MTKTITVRVDRNLFQAAKKVFQDRCGLYELTDQEFIDNAMRYICKHTNEENQMRALRTLGKTPIVITHEDLSAIAEQIKRLQYSNLRPYEG